MKIIVVMCTFNGEKYLIEQLESIKNQTATIDKFICFDDCSTDNTVKIIEEFIAQNNLTNWNVVINESNKGWRKNFYDVMAMGYEDDDIIFFADQDDVWHKNKIEMMSSIMIENPKILRLSSEQETIDAFGNAIKTFVKCKNSNTKNIEQEDFRNNIITYNWNNRIGCAMAIKGKLANYIASNYPFQKEFSHDMVSVNVSDLLCGGFVLDYACIFYRVHGSNVSHEIVNEEFRKAKINNLNKNIDYLTFLINNLNKNDITINQKMLEFVDNEIKFAELRKKWLRYRNVFAIIFNKKKYNYSNRKRTYFSDILDCLGLKKLVSKFIK